MLELVTAISVWCQTPETDLVNAKANEQKCRDQILNCVTTDKAHKSFPGDWKHLECFKEAKK